MTPEDLARQCADAINQHHQWCMPAEGATVLLVLPKGWKPPPRFPRGKTATLRPDGSRAAYFNAMNVLAWLVAHGAVTVTAIVVTPNDKQGPTPCHASTNVGHQPSPTPTGSSSASRPES